MFAHISISLSFEQSMLYIMCLNILGTITRISVTLFLMQACFKQVWWMCHKHKCFLIWGHTSLFDWCMHRNWINHTCLNNNEQWIWWITKLLNHATNLHWIIHIHPCIVNMNEWKFKFQLFWTFFYPSRGLGQVACNKQCDDICMP